MGTESDIRSWKKDDIVGTSQLVMSCIIIKVLFLMYCSAPLFLKKRKLHSFGMNPCSPRSKSLSLNIE